MNKLHFNQLEFNQQAVDMQYFQEKIRDFELKNYELKKLLNTALMERAKVVQELNDIKLITAPNFNIKSIKINGRQLYNKEEVDKIFDQYEMALVLNGVTNA